jgi:hypothetical protein
MKKVLLLLLFFSLGQSFAQSKKEQIAGLQFQLDSLGAKLTLERNLAKQNEEILNAKIASLLVEINQLNIQKKELNQDLEKKEVEIESVSKRLENSRKEVADLKNKYDSLSVAFKNYSLSSSGKDNQILKTFVEKFYGSLELSDKLSNQHNNFGGVIFNTNQFYSLLDSNAVYSKKRIQNLTGEYHGYYTMRLMSIDQIKITNQVAEIIVTVGYGIYETGGFDNEERLLINLASGRLGLLRWEDLRLKKMEVRNEYGIDDFTEKDFYKSMGSINK